MRRILLTLLATSLLANSASGQDYQNYEIKIRKPFSDVLNDSHYIKSPTADVTQFQAIQPKDGYQTFKVGDRFVFLFDPQGRPVVAFDLTLDPIGWGDMVLGSVGIGKWSLRDLWKKYKTVRDTETAEADEDDSAYGKAYDEIKGLEGKYAQPTRSADEIERGYEEFAKLEFTDEWINRNGHAASLAAGRTSGFVPASFTMADLRYNDKQKQKLYPYMAELAKALLGIEIKGDQEINEFLSGFQMQWNEQTKEFGMVVSLNEKFKSKKPVIPGWVANYVQPLDLLAYKYELSRMQETFEGLEFLLGQYGKILGILISRVTNGLKSQLDTHENQLLGYLESASNGEYDLGIPLKNAKYFIEVTKTILYLNKVTSGDDVTNGEKKRATIEKEEAKYRNENLKLLAKKGYQVQLWKDQRFATVSKDGKRKGVVNMVLKRNFFTRHPSVHFHEGKPSYKMWQRVGLEVFVDAFRFIVPTSAYLSKWLTQSLNIGIDIYIPGHFWDGLFRGRAFSEIAYEGQIATHIRENGVGKWGVIPGYSAEELAKMNASLYEQRANTFEVPLSAEAKVKSINWKRIVSLIGGRAEPEYRIQPIVERPDFFLTSPGAAVLN